MRDMAIVGNTAALLDLVEPLKLQLAHSLLEWKQAQVSAVKQGSTLKVAPPSEPVTLKYLDSFQTQNHPSFAALGLAKNDPSKPSSHANFRMDLEKQRLFDKIELGSMIVQRGDWVSETVRFCTFNVSESD